MAIPYMLAITGNVSTGESLGMREVNHVFGLVEKFSPPVAHLLGNVDETYWVTKSDGFPLMRNEARTLTKLFSE